MSHSEGGPILYITMSSSTEGTVINEDTWWPGRREAEGGRKEVLLLKGASIIEKGCAVELFSVGPNACKLQRLLGVRYCSLSLSFS